MTRNCYNMLRKVAAAVESKNGTYDTDMIEEEDAIRNAATTNTATQPNVPPKASPNSGLRSFPSRLKNFRPPVDPASTPRLTPHLLHYLKSRKPAGVKEDLSKAASED